MATVVFSPTGVWKSFRFLVQRIPVLDRYLWQLFFVPFLFGMGAFSSIGLSVGALFETVRRVVESGLPLTIAFQVLALKSPYFIGLAFPMATLLTMLLTFGRLGTNSELIALRACGVQARRWVIPAILFSLVTTGLTFVVNEAIVPVTNHQATVIVRQALDKDRPRVERRNITYQEFDHETGKNLQRLFYASRFDGRYMRGLTVLDFSQEGLQQILSAETGFWNPERKTWEFQNGTIYLVAADGSYRNIIQFNKQEITLPRAPLDLATQRRTPEEMSIVEAQDYLQILERSGNLTKIREWQVRIQQKIAIPFICLVLGLVGTALGSLPHRSSGGWAFGLSVVIIFVYYLLMFVGDALSQAGILAPVVGAWFPNVLGLATGIYLLRQADR
ncbi:LptF/LptG family permease [Gloeomargaritales cyanobacterium VI4D9]|nr:LptF/LptG family permease [Gloeomargaritales cyanobacterium VI4D9]